MADINYTSAEWLLGYRDAQRGTNTLSLKDNPDYVDGWITGDAELPINNDRFYLTQYLGELTVMERLDNNDYAKSRRIITLHSSPYKVLLAQIIVDLLNIGAQK